MPVVQEGGRALELGSSGSGIATAGMSDLALRDVALRARAASAWRSWRSVGKEMWATPRRPSAVRQASGHVRDVGRAHDPRL